MSLFLLLSPPARCSGMSRTSFRFRIACRIGSRYAAVFPDPVFALAVHQSVNDLLAAKEKNCNCARCTLVTGKKERRKRNNNNNNSYPRYPSPPMPGEWPSPAPRWGGQSSVSRFPGAAWRPIRGLKTRLPGPLPTRPRAQLFHPLLHVFASLLGWWWWWWCRWWCLGGCGFGIFFLPGAGARMSAGLARNHTYAPVTRSPRIIGCATGY